MICPLNKVEKQPRAVSPFVSMMVMVVMMIMRRRNLHSAADGPNLDLGGEHVEEGGAGDHVGEAETSTAHAAFPRPTALNRCRLLT